MEAANPGDLEEIQDVLLKETHKLILLESRMEIYATVSEIMPRQVPFNEFRKANDHTSRNDDCRAIRTILTFQQAKILIDKIDIAKSQDEHKLIIDLSKIKPRTWQQPYYYLMLDVFKRASMKVEKKQFATRFVQLRYLEASWPASRVGHRLEPLHGSMNAHTNKRQRIDAQKAA